MGAALAGLAVATFKRYQVVKIAGALIMTAGVALLTRLTPSTGLLEAAIYMVIAGAGMGTFFSVLTVAKFVYYPILGSAIHTIAGKQPWAETIEGKLNQTNQGSNKFSPIESGG